MRTRGRLAASLLGTLFLVQGACFVSRPGTSAAELHWGPMKSALYWLVLLVAEPGPVTLRLPLLLAGALTVVIACRVFQRLGGGVAGVVGGILLATDTSFIMSARLDAAGIVLPRLFLVTGGLFALRYRRLASHNIVLTAAAFAVGLLPWLASALHAPIEPASSAGVISIMDGSAWFGYVFREQPGTWGIGPQGLLESLCVRFAAAFAQPRHNLLAVTFGVALVLAIAACFLPWMPERRTLRCSLIALVTAAGSCVIHPEARWHVMLLWPLPHLVVAMLFAAAMKRWIVSAVPLGAVLVVVVFSSVAVTSTCYSRALLDGGTPYWSEAIYNLAENFDVHDARHIRILSPGIEEPLQFLKRGAAPIVSTQDMVDTLYIARTDFDLRSANLASRQVRFLRYVQDYQGRSVFELFRLE